MKTLRVYVSGSSAEIERAKSWMDRLRREPRVEVVSTWVENIATVGLANPRSASVESRALWSTTDLGEVAIADVLWLLVPPADKATRGAWVEFGYAFAKSGLSFRIASGDTGQTIFTALGIEYETDEEAFEAICDLRDELTEGDKPPSEP